MIIFDNQNLQIKEFVKSSFVYKNVLNQQKIFNVKKKKPEKCININEVPLVENCVSMWECWFQNPLLKKYLHFIQQFPQLQLYKVIPGLPDSLIP